MLTFINIPPQAPWETYFNDLGLFIRNQSEFSLDTKLGRFGWRYLKSSALVRSTSGPSVGAAHVLSWNPMQRLPAEESEEGGLYVVTTLPSPPLIRFVFLFSTREDSDGGPPPPPPAPPTFIREGRSTPSASSLEVGSKLPLLIYAGNCTLY